MHQDPPTRLPEPDWHRRSVRPCFWLNRLAAMRSRTMSEGTARFCECPRRWHQSWSRMDRHPWWRDRVLRMLSGSPDLFARLLAVHIGEETLAAFCGHSGPQLGFRILAPERKPLGSKENSAGRRLPATSREGRRATSDGIAERLVRLPTIIRNIFVCIFVLWRHLVSAAAQAQTMQRSQCISIPRPRRFTGLCGEHPYHPRNLSSQGRTGHLRSCNWSRARASCWSTWPRVRAATRAATPKCRQRSWNRANTRGLFSSDQDYRSPQGRGDAGCDRRRHIQHPWRGPSAEDWRFR